MAQISKQVRVSAARAIVREKFSDQVAKENAKRSALVLALYRQQYPTAEHAADDAFGSTKKEWLRFESSVYIKGFPGAGLELEGSGVGSLVELFTGRRVVRYAAKTTSVNLSVDVPLPKFHDVFDWQDAKGRLRQDIKRAKVRIEKLNREIENYYEDVRAVLSALNTAKKIDEHFPEAWRFLPSDCRVPKSTALVPKAAIESVRKSLPKPKGKGGSI